MLLRMLWQSEDLESVRPKTVSSIAGWVGSAFLFGIFVHSIWPYAHLLSSAVMVILALALIVVWRAKRFSWLWILAVCSAFCWMGMWRFETAFKPYGFVPFTVSGLAQTYTSTSAKSGLFFIVAQARSGMTQRISDTFPKDQAVLLNAVLTGDDRLSKPVHAQFQRAGLMHIVAVSGFKVTLIAACIIPLLLGCGLSRRYSFCIFTLVLFVMVLFIGTHASAARAAFMIWLYELAPLVGRGVRASRLLLVAAVVLCAFQPWLLLFDVSFALSFLGMWGLLTWTSWMREQLPKWVSDPWRSLLAVTFGATFATLPYTAWVFHQITIWSMVSGVLGALLVPWLMAFGWLCVLFPQIPFAPGIVSYLLQAMYVMSAWPDQIGWGCWMNVNVSWLSMLAGYVALAWAWRIVHMRTVLKKVST